MSKSIKNKLVYTIMISGTILMMLTIGIYVLFDIVTLKENKLKDVNILAKIVAENNQAALLFNDSIAAKESLYSLIANKDIEYVCIFDKENNIFAESNFISKKIVPPRSKKDIDEKTGLIEVLYDIDLQGERVGTLYIRSNLNEVNVQIKRALFLGLFILIIAIIITYILAHILQKLITVPILQLAYVSAKISKEKDFSTKIEMKRDDEIGILINSFNHMLSEIDIQNKELLESKTKAEHSSQAKEQFLANMSHEIRTPLNGIDGMARLLEGTSLVNEQKEYVTAIKNSSENLMVILNDILDISKIEAGKLSIEKVGFDLAKQLKDTLKLARYKTEEKGILLTSEIDEGISNILIGDPYRINQILVNLINNSIKFTTSGFVKIKCTLLEGTPLSNKIKFEVMDTGVGISQDKLSTIFESFAQEDASITRKFGGTGLGLSICKQLVELHGGILKVESKKGVGTIFSFALNFEVGKEDDIPKELQVMDKYGSVVDKKVLLVEDNEINQYLAITILKKWEMQVDVADNGQIAVDKLKEKYYDIVLMDMQMPVMGGIEATEVIRKELKLSTPIIALTANAINGDDVKCIEAGMDDYVSKPFNHSVLYNKILSLVNHG